MQRQLVALLPLAIAAVGSISGHYTPTNGIPEQAGPQPDSREDVTAEAGESWARPEDSDLKCSTPSAAEVGLCTALEHKILEGVVRLEVRALDDSGEWGTEISHGTVMGGRYLVTHNHFDVRISMLETMATSGAASASLFRGDGEQIWPIAGPIYFRVVAKDSQTLVLDFGTIREGEGFFESLGLSSASFRSQYDLQLAPGMEVAQVDWADDKAFVEWVQVEAVQNEAGTEILILSDDLLPGASGGGVFWQGHHIANNWTSVDVFDGAGTLLRQYSKAAINTHDAMSPLASLVVG